MKNFERKIPSALTSHFRGDQIHRFGASNICAATVICTNAQFYRYGIPDGIR